MNLSTTYAKTAGRAVHIKIYPRPHNLAESRQILQVLRQYGEIEMYQHLKACPCTLYHGSSRKPGWNIDFVHATDRFP